MAETALLADETEFFELNDAAFQRKHKGQFLLIHGKELIGVFNTPEEAVAEGIRRFGQGPFLIRQPGEREPVLSLPAYALGAMD